MITFIKKNLEFFLISIFFFGCTAIYLFPLFKGLILLPLDLLISQYAPWSAPNTILLKNPYMQDSIVQYFPWRHLVFESFTNSILPFWNPYQHLGVPFMANLKSMVFYPFNILFIFGEIKAWNMLLFSQIFISLFFSYKLARDFTLSIFSSILVSFAFSLNSLMIGLLEFGSEGHTLAMWPLLFFFAKRYMDKQSGKYLFFLGFTIMLEVFSSQLQYVAYILTVLSGFIFFYGYQKKTNLYAYISVFLSIFLGIGMSSIQLIPSLELFSYSHRGLLDYSQGKEVFTRGLIAPYQIFRLFSPDFFGNPVTRDSTFGYIETSGYFGIIPFFFCVYAMVFRRRNIFVKFFSIVFLFALFCVTKGIGDVLYILKIPFLTSGSAERIFSIVLFSGAMLSGFGLDKFIEMKNMKRNIFSLCMFMISFVFIIGISIMAISDLINIHTTFIRNIRFSLIIFGTFFLGACLYAYISSKGKIYRIFTIMFILFVVGLTYFDLFRFGYRFLTFSNERFFYHDTETTKFIRHFQKYTLARNFGLTEPELSTLLNVYSLETYNPLYLERTGIFLQALQKKSNKKLSVDNKYFFESDGTTLKHALDFLGVSLVVVDKDENPSVKHFNTSKFEGDFKLLHKDNKYAVYKNLTSYPRFGLFYDVEEVKDEKEILKRIAEGNIDFKKKLILEEKLPAHIIQGTGSAELIHTTVNTQKFAVVTDSPAIFYISDTFFPGWRVSINNKEGIIYRANYNFRAVIVPKGNSIIEFWYMPSSFMIGVVISALSLFLLAFLSRFNWLINNSVINFVEASIIRGKNKLR